jgi:hypothetical protein
MQLLVELNTDAHGTDAAGDGKPSDLIVATLTLAQPHVAEDELSAVKLLSSLDRFANEALERGDLEQFDNLFDKAIKLREQMRRLPQAVAEEEASVVRQHVRATSSQSSLATLGAKPKHSARQPIGPSLPASSTDASSAQSIADVVATALKHAVAQIAPATKRAVSPTMRVREECLAWIEPASWAAMHTQHRQCPLGEDDAFCLELFRGHLIGDARLDPVKSVPHTLKSMRRLFGMLEIEFPSGSESALTNAEWSVGFVSGLQQGQLLAKLFALDVLRADYGWSRAMLIALKHFTDFARASAIEERFDEDRKNTDDLLIKLKRLSKVHTESRHASGLKKNETDADRIGKQPEKPEIEQACMQAMFDLDYLLRHTQGQHQLTICKCSAAITMAIGLMYHNGKPGRCGEWKKIPMALARSTWIDSQSDWLAAKDHKTSKKRGAAIKVLAPGTHTALTTRYMQLPGMKDKKYLFQSPNDSQVAEPEDSTEQWSAQPTQPMVPNTREERGETVARYIQKFDKVYFGRVCHFGSNLFRKKRANNRKENIEKNARELGAWEDGHALGTEESTYIAMPHRKKADIARKNLMLEIEPVDWPTEQEMASMRTVYFAHPRRGDGGISVDAVAGGEHPQREGMDARRGGPALGRFATMAKKRRRTGSVATNLKPPKRAKVSEVEAGKDEEGAEEEVEDVRADIEPGAEEHLLQLLESHVNHGSSQGARSSTDQPPDHCRRPTRKPDATSVLGGAELGGEIDKEAKSLLDAAEVVPDAKRGRRIEYDPAKGVFTKHETAVPNLVVHAVVKKAMTQRKLVLAPSSHRANETRNPDGDGAANAAGPPPNASSDKVYEISEADQQVLWAHAAVARGEGFTELEKMYLISKLRLAQGTLNDPLRKNVLELIIRKGLEEGVLVRVLLTPAKFFERVRQFVRQFIKMSEADQDDEPVVAASSAVASSAGDAEDID